MMSEFAPYTQNILLSYGFAVIVLGFIATVTFRASIRARRHSDRQPDDDT